MKEVASKMGLLRIGFYKSPAIIPHNPEHDARFVSNNGFWYLSLVRRSCAWRVVREAQGYMSGPDRCLRDTQNNRVASCINIFEQLPDRCELASAKKSSQRMASIIIHGPRHDARFVSNSDFWYLSLVYQPKKFDLPMGLGD
jgi:hypothetical protein